SGLSKGSWRSLMRQWMGVKCPECGAPLPEGGSCRDNFDALLALEWEIPGGPGEIAHFYAVGSYVLQHPEGMNYTAEALSGLRRRMADHLRGRIDLAEIRRQNRKETDGAKRVTRRAGESAVPWPVASWPLT